jgi:hypothetical protein
LYIAAMLSAGLRAFRRFGDDTLSWKASEWRRLITGLETTCCEKWQSIPGERRQIVRTLAGINLRMAATLLIDGHEHLQQKSLPATEFEQNPKFMRFRYAKRSLNGAGD